MYVYIVKDGEKGFPSPIETIYGSARSAIESIRKTGLQIMIHGDKVAMDNISTPYLAKVMAIDNALKLFNGSRQVLITKRFVN